MFFSIDKGKKSSDAQSFFFFFFFLFFPIPKENELTEKVIEFDQSIETNFRERERETERNLCCEWVEILSVFYEKQTEIALSALLTLLPHHSLYQNNPPLPIPLSLSLSLSLSLISKSKIESGLCEGFLFRTL